MALLDEVVGALRQHAVPFALAGAAALAIHGVSRSTLDLDFVTTDPRALDRAMWDGLARSDATVDVRRGDRDDPLAGVIRIRRQDERPVDIVIGRHRWQTDAIGRAGVATYLGVELPALRAADLVLFKVYAGGTQDRWDVAMLLATAGDACVAEVDARVRDLPGDLAACWRQWRGDRA